MITAEEFKEFLNQESITEDRPDLVLAVVQIPHEYRSSILIKSVQDHEERITIDFAVKFEHHESQEKGRIFQREFAIEHHPEDRSRHTEPHVQFHIHGANPDQKVGKLWLILDLESEEEYEQCIQGFFAVLEEIAEQCGEGLDDALLNIPEFHKLTAQKTLLLDKIQASLRTKGIEYEYPDGTKKQLFLDDIDEVTSQDKALLPLLKPEE